MTRKFGWKEEAVWGTNPLATPATDVIQRFGIDDFDREHPWHKQSNSLLTQNDELRPVDAVPGIMEHKVKHRTAVVSADEWKYALGKITGSYVFSIGTAAWKSRAVYSEIGDNISISLGCYTENLDFIAELGQPLLFDIGLRSKYAILGSKNTNATTQPTHKASLDSNLAWKWTHSNDLEYNDVDLANITRIHVGIHNVLADKPSIMYEQIQALERLSCFVTCDFDCWLDGTANDLLAKLQAGGFVEAATNDFEYKFQRTVGANTAYHTIHVHNLKFESVQIPVKKGKYVGYHIIGIGYYDGTNDLIDVTVDDGAAYS